MKKNALVIPLAIAAAISAKPRAEISIPYTADGVKCETAISYDLVGVRADIDGVERTVKHFSIEHYENNDIDDAFIISVRNCKYGADAWNVLTFEAWKNTDDAWINFEFGF